jgi:hypothetical protein
MAVFSGQKGQHGWSIVSKGKRSMRKCHTGRQEPGHVGLRGAWNLK